MKGLSILSVLFGDLFEETLPFLGDFSEMSDGVILELHDVDGATSAELVFVGNPALDLSIESKTA